jgi:hypothetical protein
MGLGSGDEKIVERQISKKEIEEDKIIAIQIWKI